MIHSHLYTSRTNTEQTHTWTSTPCTDTTQHGRLLFIIPYDSWKSSAAVGFGCKSLVSIRFCQMGVCWNWRKVLWGKGLGRFWPGGGDVTPLVVRTCVDSALQMSCHNEPSKRRAIQLFSAKIMVVAHCSVVAKNRMISQPTSVIEAKCPSTVHSLIDERLAKFNWYIVIYPKSVPLPRRL